MGLIVLHSGHFSKIFKRLMGTTHLADGGRGICYVLDNFFDTLLQSTEARNVRRCFLTLDTPI